jgi:hypothetical protein
VSFETQLSIRSEGIANHLLSKQLATQAEIDACGVQADLAADDPETALIVRYGDLRALHAERAPEAGQRSDRQKKADRVVLDALRGASKPVKLTTPVNDMREVNVYPKSLNALVELAERDAVIGFFNSGLQSLRAVMSEHPTAERADLLTQAAREIAYQTTLCCWIVTHNAPGLPYPEGTGAPDVPAFFGDLSPLDILYIFSAHEEVNSGRLAALQALWPAKVKAERTERGWGVYLANLASLLNTSAEQLARNQSLAALFAQSYVHAVEQERAMEEAKR